MFLKWSGWLILFLILFLSGQTWWGALASADRMFIGPEIAIIQTVEGITYSLGDTKKLKTVRPFGYFSDGSDWIHPSTLKTQTRQGQMTRWTDHFVMLDTGRSRVLWIEEGFDVSLINASRSHFESDVWILDTVIPPENFPPPREMIIWLSGQKRVPKKITELTATHQLPVIMPSASGQQWLVWRDGQWVY